MKKRVVMLMLVTVVGLTACSREEEEIIEYIQESTEEIELNVEKYNSPVEVLRDIHCEFDKDTMKYLGGKGVQGEPVELSLEEDIESLVIPKEYIGFIDKAGCIGNLLNSNTYTSVAVHITDFSKLSEIEESILSFLRENRSSLSEKVLIGIVENYLVYAYGNAEIISQLENGIKGNRLGEVRFVGSLIIVDSIDIEDMEIETESMPEES